MTLMPEELERASDIQHSALRGRSRTQIRCLFDSSERRIKAQRILNAGTCIFARPRLGSLPKTLARHMIYRFCVAREDFLLS
jgi:hypothetical protein